MTLEPIRTLHDIVITVFVPSAQRLSEVPHHCRAVIMPLLLSAFLYVGPCSCSCDVAILTDCVYESCCTGVLRG